MGDDGRKREMGQHYAKGMNTMEEANACTDPSCKAPNCKSGPSAVGPCPHFSCIAPSLNLPSTHPPTHPYLTIHPASVPAVACHQRGQPRSPKCSEATSGLRSFVGFGLVKITVLSHGQESFPVWAWPNVLQPHPVAPWTEPFHGQTVCPMDRA